MRLVEASCGNPALQLPTIHRHWVPSTSRDGCFLQRCGFWCHQSLSDFGYRCEIRMACGQAEPVSHSCHN